MVHYQRDVDDKTSDLDLDYDKEGFGGPNDTDERADSFFTEALSGDSILWWKRWDGAIYVETRSSAGAWNAMTLPKDEAIRLMAWLSENTK